LSVDGGGHVWLVGGGGPPLRCTYCSAYRCGWHGHKQPVHKPSHICNRSRRHRLKHRFC
jgi:hypothetical protein